jgi:hypothetical protein
LAVARSEITDEEALRRLRAASDALGADKAQTLAANTALEFARFVLVTSMEAIEAPETAQGVLRPEQPRADD